MIVRDGDSVRLELALPVALAYHALVPVLGGLVLGAAGVAELVALAAGAGHPAVLGPVAIVVIAGAVLLILVALRAARRARTAVPRLAATPGVLTLTRGGRPAEHLDRHRVARADYRYHRATAGAPYRSSKLTWRDGHGHVVAHWELDPLFGRSMAAWLSAVGIPGTVAVDCDGPGTRATPHREIVIGADGERRVERNPVSG